MQKFLSCIVFIICLSKLSLGQEYIFVANIGSNTVSYYDVVSGEYLGDFVKSGYGGLLNPTGITFGPDGNLYVSSSGNNKIIRYDGLTGEFIDIFAEGDTLGRPFSIVFGDDGHMYMSSGTKHVVYRLNGNTGEIISIAASNYDLKQPIGLRYWKGSLFVSNSGGRTIQEYNVDEGKLVNTTIRDSLKFNSDLVFDNNNHIYVSNASGYSITKYDATNGSYIKNYLLPDKGVPMGLAVGSNNIIYVGDFAKSRLYKFYPSEEKFELLATKGLNRPENIIIKINI